MADIPGLIEGAHEGQGLGDRFLGHVERTSILLHLIDITQDDLAGAYHTIRKELEEYGHGLTDKPEIVALNKVDVLGEDLSEDQLEEFKAETGLDEVYTLSALNKKNLDAILYKIAETVNANKQEQKEQDERDAQGIDEDYVEPYAPEDYI